MAIASFDKLHVISQKSTSISMPYDQYFGEMDLSDEEIQKRIKVATQIELSVLSVFSFITALGNEAEHYRDYTIEQLQGQYQNAIDRYVDVNDAYIKQYLLSMATSIVNTTLLNLTISDDTKDDYYVSDDRAMYVAENEANSVMNYQQFQEALKQEHKKKKWMTMNDKHVRRTHAAAEGTVIEIKELFHIGDSLMLFPKDLSHGASAKETIGCRCSVKYL